MTQKPLILAIETSCDETAAAVFLGKTELSSVILSQIEIHNKFGGVVPEVASRNHTMAIAPVVEQCLSKANVSFSNLTHIAVTEKPGLAGALLVGLSYAGALALALNIKLIKVNHIQAHIAANFIDTDLQPPFTAVVASGGHTSIINVKNYNSYTTLLSTLDDAIGECFDKVARVLNLGYPGGPIISSLAANGDKNKIEFFKNAVSTKKNIKNISYSGLKTSAINYINNLRQKQNGTLTDAQIADICASLQHTAVTLLVNAVINISINTENKTIALGGGVAANTYLRDLLTLEARNKGFNVVYPPLKYCTDNASMVAMRAYLVLPHGQNDALV